MAKKKEAPVQTMGGTPVKKTKTTKKTAPKKAVKKTAPKKKGKTKAEILSKPTKVVRKSVVKNEEHSDFDAPDEDTANDTEEENGDDLDAEGSEDDSLEY